jgi:hypothetical protein
MQENLLYAVLHRIRIAKGFSVFFVPNEPSGWTDLINESVHTSDDQDIGDIEAVSRNFIV